MEDDSPVFEEPLPVMTNNVFGLDHSKIMSRLLAARKKTRDAWSGLNTIPGIISYRVPADKLNEPAVANQRKELADFLLKRQVCSLIDTCQILAITFEITVNGELWVKTI